MSNSKLVMQVKDLTIEELKSVIRETVIESLEDLLPDPDAGKTVKVQFQQELLETRKQRQEGTKNISPAEVKETLETNITSNNQESITRTERGITITGTRITLYDVMDYIEYPPKFVRELFNLTEAQANAAFEYIHSHRDEVEKEHQIVLKEAEDLKKHYDEQNHNLIAKIAKMPPPKGREAIWEKLQTQKAKLQARPEILV
jgi:hypothetical protein